jgi:hypothetical protein
MYWEKLTLFSIEYFVYSSTQIRGENHTTSVYGFGSERIYDYYMCKVSVSYMIVMIVYRTYDSIYDSYDRIW